MALSGPTTFLTQKLEILFLQRTRSTVPYCYGTNPLFCLLHAQRVANAQTPCRGRCEHARFPLRPPIQERAPGMNVGDFGACYIAADGPLSRCYVCELRGCPCVYGERKKGVGRDRYPSRAIHEVVQAFCPQLPCAWENPVNDRSRSRHPLGFARRRCGSLESRST